jgi:hypothetical protein
MTTNLETVSEEPTEAEPQPAAPPGVFFQVTRDENGEPSVAGISPVGDVKISETQFVLERAVALYRAQVGL